MLGSKAFSLGFIALLFQVKVENLNNRLRRCDICVI
jgi:hypothetical protein